MSSDVLDLLWIADADSPAANPRRPGAPLALGWTPPASAAALRVSLDARVDPQGYLDDSIVEQGGE